MSGSSLSRALLSFTDAEQPAELREMNDKFNKAKSTYEQMAGYVDPSRASLRGLASAPHWPLTRTHLRFAQVVTPPKTIGKALLLSTSSHISIPQLSSTGTILNSSSNSLHLNSSYSRRTSTRSRNDASTRSARGESTRPSTPSMSASWRRTMRRRRLRRRR